MKGKIVYELFTVRGTVKIDVEYNILMNRSGTARAKILTFGEGDPPRELQDQNVMDEIVDLCMQDVLKKATEPEDYQRVLPDSLWGAN